MRSPIEEPAVAAGAIVEQLGTEQLEIDPRAARGAWAGYGFAFVIKDPIVCDAAKIFPRCPERPTHVLGRTVCHGAVKRTASSSGR
jgi:hypothetical protein